MEYPGQSLEDSDQLPLREMLLPSDLTGPMPTAIGKNQLACTKKFLNMFFFTKKKRGSSKAPPWGPDLLPNDLNEPTGLEKVASHNRRIFLGGLGFQPLHRLQAQGPAELIDQPGQGRKLLQGVFAHHRRSLGSHS